MLLEPLHGGEIVVFHQLFQLSGGLFHRFSERFGLGFRKRPQFLYRAVEHLGKLRQRIYSAVVHLIEQHTAGTQQRVAPKVARKSDEIMQQRTRVRETAMLQMQPHILRRAAVRPQEPAAQRGKLLSVPAEGGKRFRCIHCQREVPPQNLIQPVRPHRHGNAVVHTGVQCPLADTSHRISGQRQQRLALHHKVDLAVIHEQHRLFLVHLG